MGEIMVLHIAKRGDHNIGAKMHLQALIDLYGEDHVFIIDLLRKEPEKRKNYVAFGKYKNYFDRINRFFERNVVYINNKIIKEICKIIDENNIEMVFMEESDLGNLTKEIKTTFPEVKVVCFYHDISADLFAQRRKHASWMKPHYKFLECNITIWQEQINQKYCDENWAFHECDAERFRHYYGYTPNVLIPLSAPVPAISDAAKRMVTSVDANKHILFVCSEYYVNIRGFRWFYDHVLPKLEFNFHMTIIGTGSTLLLDFCKDVRISIKGSVDSVKKYYEQADIVIAPVFDGGGMKVKILEAFSFAKCLVSTSESLNGYWEALPDTLKNDIVHKCDTVEEWVSALNKLAKSNVKKYNEDLFDVFKRNFSYEVMLAAFRKQLYKNI